MNKGDRYTFGTLHKCTCYDKPLEPDDYLLNNIIPAEPSWLWKNEWFGGRQKWGWVFDNYFHALAYSMKVKNQNK